MSSLAQSNVFLRWCGPNKMHWKISPPCGFSYTCILLRQVGGSVAAKIFKLKKRALCSRKFVTLFYLILVLFYSLYPHCVFLT